MISEFVEYVKQVWKNKPNVSSPLNADRLNHMEAGIENNSKKIKETVTVVNENTEKTDAALAIAGKPDEYSTSKTYAVGDKCIYKNALYKCTIAISAAEAWTAGHWTKTSLCAEDAANKAAIKELTEKTKKYPDKRVGNIKITTANTYQKVTSSDTLPAGIYIAVATAEALKDDDSSNFVGWMPIPFPGDNPLTGDANAVNFPSRGRYPTIDHMTILELKKSDQISVYIYSGSTTVPFNVSLKVTRVG